MKRLFIFSLVVAISISAFFFANVAFAQNDSSYGLNATAGAAGLKKYDPNVSVLIGNVIGTALSLVSVIFFILAVYGGFRMMLARGQEDEFTKGRDILIHATVGLIIILASYAITSFVFQSVGPGSGGGNTNTVVTQTTDGTQTGQDDDSEQTAASATTGLCVDDGTAVAFCKDNVGVENCSENNECKISNENGTQSCVPANETTCGTHTGAGACENAAGCKWQTS